MSIELINHGTLQAITQANFADQQKARALGHQIAELGLSLEDRAETGLVGAVGARLDLGQIESLLASLKAVWSRRSKRDESLDLGVPLTGSEFEGTFGADVRPDTRSFDVDDLIEMGEQVALRG